MIISILHHVSTALATESDFYDECTFVITAIESMDLMVLQPYGIDNGEGAPFIPFTQCAWYIIQSFFWYCTIRVKIAQYNNFIIQQLHIFRPNYTQIKVHEHKIAMYYIQYYYGTCHYELFPILIISKAILTVDTVYNKSARLQLCI